MGGVWDFFGKKWQGRMAAHVAPRESAAMLPAPSTAGVMQPFHFSSRWWGLCTGGGDYTG